MSHSTLPVVSNGEAEIPSGSKPSLLRRGPYQPASTEGPTRSAGSYQRPVHTVVFRNKVYREIPGMDYKRNDHDCQIEGPLRKVRKVVNMAPGVRDLLRARNENGMEAMDARLMVRQEGNEVFITIRVGHGNNVQYIPVVPREQQSRRRPTRSAGR